MGATFSQRMKIYEIFNGTMPCLKFGLDNLLDGLNLLTLKEAGYFVSRQRAYAKLPVDDRYAIIHKDSEDLVKTITKHIKSNENRNTNNIQ